MILTVALNAALDLTYRLPAVNWAGTNRVESVSRCPGGKAVNVARVLRTLGYPVVVTGFAGGRTGDEVRALLADAGITDALLPIAGDSRRTVAVVDDQGAATMFNEPGPTISESEWRGLVRRVARLCDKADAVVLSGSLPPGVSPDVYAVLARRAAAAGVPVLLDADGPALLHGLVGRPAIVKPNAEELVRATAATDPLTGAQALRRAGAESVVVSLGPDGMVAATPDGSWRAIPPERYVGNPTGAGDAAVAALAVGVVTSQPWPLRLAHATAASAAAVQARTAGEMDHTLYRELLHNVQVLAWDEISAGGFPCRS